MSNSSPIISLLNHSPNSAAAAAAAAATQQQQSPPLPTTATGTSSTSSASSATLTANTSNTSADTHHHQQQTQDSKVPPRKRSKVSRLCDECRRKKIKCDASLQSSMSSTNTQCSNCFKTNEFCTFTRIPLKRGPTKGYIRDFEGKVDMEHRRNSSSAASTLSQQLQHQGKDSFSHHLPPLPVSQQHSNSITTTTTTTTNNNNNNNIQPIVLPPIDQSRSRAGSNLTLSPRSSVPNIPIDYQISNNSTNPPLLNPYPNNSAATAAAAATSATSGIGSSQGHFWKVPYEYSSFNNDRRNSADSLSSSISDSFSPFLNNSGNNKKNSKNKKPRLDSNSIVSDSDDEIYLRKSSLRSPSVQPPQIATSSSTSIQQAHQLLQLLQVIKKNSIATARSPDSLSVSSLSSLNNKLNVGLNFDQQQLQQAAADLKTSIDLKNVEQNIVLYYTNYHSNTMILPLDSSNFINSILNLQLTNEVEVFIVDLFNSSLLLLNNSNKNSQLFIDDIRLVFQQIIKTYPIFNKDILSIEILKLLFLSTLIILNYCIVLSGQDYSIGLNVTIGIFNDFKIDKIYKQVAQNSLELDDIAVIYARLYFHLQIFDNVNSIGYNKNRSVIAFEEDCPIEKLIPPSQLQDFKFQKLILERVSNKDDIITQLMKVCNSIGEDGGDVMTSSLKEFVQLYELIIKMKDNYTSKITRQDDDEEEEYIFDNFLRITRIVRKQLNQLSIFFDKFFGSENLIKNLNFMTLLNISIFFKILMLSKNLIISIIKFQKKIGNHDLMSRLKKLELDITSIYYKIFKNLNFENLNISLNLNLINQRITKNIQTYDDISMSSDSKNSLLLLVTKIEEWVNYIDSNFIKIVNDDEYGWLF